MSRSIRTQKVKLLQAAVLCLILCLNLFLTFGILTADAYLKGFKEMLPYFGIPAALAAVVSIWLGFRAAYFPFFMSYRQAAKVYYPGMLISLLVPVDVILFMRQFTADSHFAVLPVASGIFLVICLAIKLNASRHAFD